MISRTQGDSSTEAFDIHERRRVTKRRVARVLQIQEREQGETESQYSEISNIPSRPGSLYALDIPGAIYPERPPPLQAWEAPYQPNMNIPTQSRLLFRWERPGEGMVVDALSEGFLVEHP